MTASQTLTPSQARFMQETKERHARFAAKGKPETRNLIAIETKPPVYVPPVAEPEPSPPVQPWAERQIQLYETWFSIESEIDPPAAAIPSMGVIQRICAAYYAMTLTEMLSERRLAHLVRARQVAMFLCKEFTMRSLPEIGRRFAGRDHTTVLHAVRRIAEKESYDKDLADDLNTLRKLIREAC